MEELIVNEIIMQGFKNHKNSIKYQLNNRTLIIGENGQGKTTVGEAITWCLLGTDLTGNERATTRLINNQSKIIYVEIDFEFKGEKHNLIRRKKGSKIDVYLNGNEIKNNDLVQFYRDKDTFLSVFNPSYFPSLAPKQAKKLLNNILKEVTNEEVFEKISDFEKDLLLKNSFKNPNLFLERKREELKEIEDDIIFEEGFIAAKKEDIEIPKRLEFDGAELECLHAKQQEMKEFMQILKQNDKPPLIEVDSIKRELDFTRNKYGSLQKEFKSLDNKIECPNCKYEIDLDADRKNNLNRELGKLEGEGKKLVATVEQYEDENKKIMELYEKKVKENEVELTKVASEYAKITNSIQGLENERQKVESNNATRDHLLKLQEENEIKIKKAKDDITGSGKRKRDIKMQMDAAKEFNSIKLKLQAKNINAYLDKVNIQLQKITQQGEIKDDFKILYDDKEFSILSNSERIKSGLEIANLIMNNIDMKFPIFIDNVESITSYNEPSTQIIEAKVVEGQELRITEVQ